MPLLFIHGVNVRDTDETYAQHIATRKALLRRHLVEPLAAKGVPMQDIEPLNPYWGKYGVKFRWALASLPEVNTLEHLGADDGTPQADLEFVQLLDELAGRKPATAAVESLGVEDGRLRRAARKDLTRFVETILMPLLLAEARLDTRNQANAEEEGLYQALLASAAYEVANDAAIQAAVAAAASDDAVIELLKAALQTRFEAVVRSTRPSAPAKGDVEELGPDWLESLKARVGEFFDRAKDAPGRVATLPLLDKYRARLHGNVACFLGDIFVYLNERNEAAQPGLIIQTVLQALQNAPRRHAHEPLIVITHSMGGNILYDILTYYAPTLKLDVWVSVGGQVAQFEEMKLFKGSKPEISTPQKVTGLKPNVGYWLNVYDPADILSFKAAPVFADVDADVEYLTGASALKAHGEYFGRASFYEMVRMHIEKALHVS